MGEHFRFGSVGVDVAGARLLVDGQQVPLQPLAWQLLLLLVRAPRQLFTREQLHEALWPGVTVTPDSLSQVVRRLRQALPRPDVVQTMPRRGYRLDADVELDVPKQVHAARDAFFGRADQLRSLSEGLVAGAPFLTLVGPAGVGKTRLALELVAGWSACRVQVVDLSTADDLVRAVAATLGLALGRAPMAEVGAALAAGGRQLLVLDNLETVLPAAANVLERWIAAAPAAQWLVTSRVVAHVPGERVVEVEPLELGAATDLLADRCDAPRPPAGLERLAEAMGGLPLALELVAPRLRVLTPDEVLAHLDHRFALLRRVRAGAHPHRHRSLQAALDASWEPLDVDGRRALTQLVTWVGPFDLDQARAVLDPGAPVLDVLQTLRDQSLLARRGDGRFAVLPTIREYVEEHGDPEIRASAEARHGAWLAPMGAPEAVGRFQQQPSGAAATELLEDLIAASRRAAARGDGDVAVPTAAIARQVLRMRGPPGLAVALLERARDAAVGDARARAERLLVPTLLDDERFAEARVAQAAVVDRARGTGDPRIHGTERLQLAMVLDRCGDHHAARTEAEAALPLLRRAEDRYHEGLAHVNLGNVAQVLGESQRALDHYDDAWALADALQHERLGQFVLHNRAIALQALGRLDDALADHLAALRVDEAHGNLASEASTRGNIATVLGARGDWDAAIEEAHRGLALSRRVGKPVLTAMHLENLGGFLSRAGRHAEARPVLEEAIRTARDAGDRLAELAAVAVLAEVDAAAGRPADAVAVLDRTVPALADLGEPRPTARALLARAEALLDLEREASARADLEAAGRLLAGGGEQLLLGTLACLEARVALRSGDASAAREARVRAESIAVAAGVGPASELRQRISALERPS